MNNPRSFRLRALVGLTISFLFASSAFAAAPLKALLVTGGCCHDFEAQNKILSEGGPGGK